jgi:hypothetical protein
MARSDSPAATRDVAGEVRGGCHGSGWNVLIDEVDRTASPEKLEPAAAGAREIAVSHGADL